MRHDQNWKVTTLKWYPPWSKLESYDIKMISAMIKIGKLRYKNDMRHDQNWKVTTLKW